MAENKNDKITVRFESTLETNESNPLLLSGPIEIFDVGETINDLEDDGTKSLMQRIHGSSLPSIVIFIENVTDSDAQPYRGAYFLFIGDRNSNKCSIHDWQEILLGTHSHTNIEALESFSKAVSGKIDSDKLIVVDSDNKIKLINFDEKQELPELPDDYKEKIEELKKYRELEEPIKGEDNHLDAPLDELQNTYDYLNRDEYGNYVNLAVGNCRDLYRSLIKADKKLYLTSDYDISEEKTELGWLGLEIFPINFDYNVKVDDYENVSLSPTNSNRLLITLTLPYNILENDRIFLFNKHSDEEDQEDEFIETSRYDIVNIEKNKITISFIKKYFTGKQNLTVLVVKDFSGNGNDLIESFKEKKLNLYKINNTLIKLFMRGEFSRKPALPKLYLTTDEYGNLSWENKLLPSQKFYAEKIDIKPEDLVGDSEEITINVNTPYILGEDFPLIMIDQFFVSDATFENKDNKTTTIHIKKEYFNEDGNTLTFVLIRNSASEVVEKFAENYLTKEDAVEILSRGRIKLTDYAKYKDLINFAKVSHTHDQYALKGHNHDYRYANFHHTHPELALLISEISNGKNPEDIEKWINDLSEKVGKQFSALVSDLGLYEENGKYFITDKNLRLTNNAVDEINRILKLDEIDKELKNGASLSDALIILAELFERDTVLDSQVILEDPIKVKYNIGGILAGKSYDKGTDLRKILTDLFNPYISEQEALRLLTPVDIELEWYRKKKTENNTNNDDLSEGFEIVTDEDSDNPDNFKKIDPYNLLEYEIKEDPILYFKIIGWKNYRGEECRSSTNLYGRQVDQITTVFIEGDNRTFHKYALKSNDLSTRNKIEFSWKVTCEDKINEIYDNYGLNIKDPLILNAEELKLNVLPDLEYGTPKIFIGTISKKVLKDYELDIENDVYKLLQASFLVKPKEFKCNLKEKNLILLLLSKSFMEKNDVAIYNVYTGNRIENFFIPATTSEFETIEVPINDNITEEYYIYYYDVLATDFDEVKIQIHGLAKIEQED